jgi:hypothetical protein
MEGRFKAGSRGDVRVQMKDAVHQRAEYEVFSRLQLPPGRYQLRLSLRHILRDETGSVYCDIDVPDFSKSGLTLSDLVLDAGPSRLVSAPPELFADVLRVLPTATRQFAGGARLTAFLRLVQGGRTPLTPVSVTMQLIDENGEAVRTQRQTIWRDDFDAQRTAEYRIQLPDGALRPGWYLLRIEAALGGSPQRREIAFRITS